MNKTLSIIFGFLVVLLVTVPAHSQSNSTRKDYTVVDSDDLIESGKKVLITEYAFKGSTVKTREKYFGDREEQDEGLAAATKSYNGCGPQLEIFNNTGIIMGRKIVCEDKTSKTYIIAYSHFDSLNKVNVIIGASEGIVEDFVSGICPYAYDLYLEPDCPDFDRLPEPDRR